MRKIETNKIHTEYEVYDTEEKRYRTFPTEESARIVEKYYKHIKTVKEWKEKNSIVTHAFSEFDHRDVQGYVVSSYMFNMNRIDFYRFNTIKERNLCLIYLNYIYYDCDTSVLESEIKKGPFGKFFSVRYSNTPKIEFKEYYEEKMNKIINAFIGIRDNMNKELYEKTNQ